MASLPTLAATPAENTQDRPAVIGLLLAAGLGTRFDPSGRNSKLLATLPDGRPVVAHAARALQQAVDAVVAVVAPGSSPALEHTLQSLGITLVECTDARLGMGHSVACGIRATHPGTGWLIALGDMPFVRPGTCSRLAGALREGHDIVVPMHGSQRGNPVGFSTLWRPQLEQLSGDRGARDLLARPDAHRLPVDDPGILRDIDHPGDLPA